MRLKCLLVIVLGMPLLAVAQQAAPSAEVQPQAWPPAQPKQGAPQPSAAPVRSAAPATPSAGGQIQLDVVVTDKAGNPIRGLDRGDFTLLDNGHPIAIQSFKAYGGPYQPPTPTLIFIVIDTVNIDFNEVSYSRFGIDDFLHSNGGKLAHPVSVSWYTDDGLVGGVRPTTDGKALAAQLDGTEGHLRTITRAAGAWGAIERFEMSLQVMNRIAHSVARVPGRKLLIWIGPGWPILDDPDIQMSWKEQQGMFRNIVDLSTLVREGQLQIYSVAPGTPNIYTFLYEGYVKGVKKAQRAYLPDMDLKVLAVQSGGLVIPPSNDLGSQIARCARDADTYYRLSFIPPAADGPNEYHSLKVRVDRPRVTARTSTGYYDQPPGTPPPK